jgi:hypothetical protein
VRKVMIIASVGICGVLALLAAYLTLFFTNGPSPILPNTAAALLNSDPAFRTSESGTREVEAVKRVYRASPSEVNNYYVEFRWRWKSKPQAANREPVDSSAEFEYKDGRWYLRGFGDKSHGWVTAPVQP